MTKWVPKQRGRQNISKSTCDNSLELLRCDGVVGTLLKVVYMQDWIVHFSKLPSFSWNYHQSVAHHLCSVLQEVIKGLKVSVHVADGGRAEITVPPSSVQSWHMLPSATSSCKPSGWSWASFCPLRCSCIHTVSWWRVFLNVSIVCVCMNIHCHFSKFLTLFSVVPEISCAMKPTLQCCGRQ